MLAFMVRTDMSEFSMNPRRDNGDDAVVRRNTGRERSILLKRGTTDHGMRLFAIVIKREQKCHSGTFTALSQGERNRGKMIRGPL